MWSAAIRLLQKTLASIRPDREIDFIGCLTQLMQIKRQETYGACSLTPPTDRHPPENSLPPGILLKTATCRNESQNIEQYWLRAFRSYGIEAGLRCRTILYRYRLRSHRPTLRTTCSQRASVSQTETITRNRFPISVRHAEALRFFRIAKSQIAARMRIGSNA